MAARSVTTRGRKPKPTAQKELEGNPGKRPLNKNEPKFAPKAPGCPTWLTLEAKAEWRRLVAELDAIGMLTKVDRAAMATFCQQWAIYKDAIELVKRDGMVLMVAPVTYVDLGVMSEDRLAGLSKQQLLRLAEYRNVPVRRGATKSAIATAIAEYSSADEVIHTTTIYVNAVPNPMLKTAKDAATLVRQLAVEFGLTPSARTRIELPDSDDELDDLLGPPPSAPATITRLDPTKRRTKSGADE